MDNNVMVKVDHVSKQYRLGMIGGTTLREEMQRKLAKLRGMEDPTQKIGEKRKGRVGELFFALDDVSFEVQKGEAVGIIGHNGAGKSTILKLISQVTGPTSGSIELNGRVASMLEVGTGFHPELSGRENIYMNGAILGMTKAEIDRKIEEIINFSECRQFIDTPVKRYSSGMYVKLAFSVAAHLESEILIMDEVLAVGDAKFQEKCLGRMGDEAHGGRTVLYVSHNMNTIRALCDRVIVLDHGKIVFDGAVESGVDIYNGLKELSSNVIDLASLPRMENAKGHRYTLDRLEMESGSRFSFGSVVKGKLRIMSPELTTHVGVYYNIGTLSDIRVTRMDTEKEVYLKQGVNETEFLLDISKLIPGKYILALGLVRKNSWGSEDLLDYIQEAFCFEIVRGSDCKLPADWNPHYFGYYIGPGVHICEAENDS